MIELEQLRLSSDSDNQQEHLLEIALAEATAYYQLEKFTEVKTTLDTYLKLHGKDLKDQDLARFYNFYGTLFYSIGSYNESIDWYNAAYELIKEAPLTTSHANILNNMGVLMQHVNQFEKAVDYYKRALELAEKLKQDDQRGDARHMNSMINVGIACTELGQIDTAYYYLNKSLKKAEELQDSTYIFNSLMYLGNLSLKENKLKLAEGYYYTLLELKPTRKSLLIDVNNKLGDLALKSKQFSKAASFFTTASNLSNGDKPSNLSAKTASSQYLLYKELNKHDEALFYLEQYNKQKDSIRNQEITKKILALNFKINDPSPKIIKNKNRLIYLLLSAVIIVCLIIAIIIIFLNQQKLRLKNQELQLDLNVATEKLLKEDLIYKNKELTAKSLQLSNNDNFKTQIIQQLEEALDKDDLSMRKRIRKIISSIEITDSDSFWQQFELFFTETNPQFYKNLQKAFPNLTQNELRLCAYSKMNLSIKEISNITHQTQNTVRVARTRLRKKLKINNTKISLHEFLNQF